MFIYKGIEREREREKAIKVLRERFFGVLIPFFFFF
jgi:hypothetical protein